jgi:uncharacterized repeat protein (TIGR01451 family)
MFARSNSILVALLIAAAFLLGIARQALADGTPSGTVIDNSATVDYTVGGVSQAQITSNVASFVVDNRVDLTVTTVDAANVEVVPGSVNQVLTFTVTNDGNTTQDYSLTALDAAANPFGLPETFDAANVRVFVDGNGNNTFDLGTDTAVYIDELAMDTSVTVFVVSDIPAGQVDGDVASYDLVAQTAAGGTAGSQGADITSDDAGDADDPTLVQIVFADGAGSADAANDGQHSSGDGYLVMTAALNVAKSAAVISDPINNLVNPKAIPGAVMAYTIDIDNVGAAAAGNVAIEDAIPANSAFVVGTVVTNPSGPGVATVDYNNGAGWGYSPVVGPDGTDPAVTAVRVTFVNIASGASVQEVFRVRID